MIEILFLLEIVFILALFAVVLFGDFIPAFKTAKKGEKIFGIAVYAVTFTILFLTSIEVSLPNPSAFIMDIIKFIFGPIKP